MTTFLWLVLAIGVAPLLLGLARLERSGARPTVDLASLLLCALAFNLTFFWQELWLVVPKAFAGLDPILYHNDHDWRGEAPIAELLQGTGALATLDSGLAFGLLLAMARNASATWRLFFFWMAFQGLFQSLTQLAIGALLPGNDVGRALAYLQVGPTTKASLPSLAMAGMWLAGAWLARRWPGERPPVFDRAFGVTLLLTALASVALIVPFRVPRHPIEVALIPVVVNLVGAGCLVLGASFVRRPVEGGAGRARLLWPALALLALLAVFQLVLRPGIAF